MMPTNSQDIDAANDIARSRLAARPTAIYPSCLVPCATNRACLRRVCFIDCNRATAFVIQLPDQLGITGATHLLCRTSSALLGCIIKRLADIARGPRERVNHLAGGFMSHVADASVRLRQHSGLPPLQPLPLARAFRLRALGVLAVSQTLVPILHGGFRRPTTDQDGLLSVCGCQQGIDPQVHADDALLRSRAVFNLTDQTHCRHTEPHFHQSPRHGDRDGDTEPPTCSMGQQQRSSAQPAILVGIHDMAVSRFFPRIPRFLTAVLAQLARAVHGRTELANDLLRTLGAEAWISPLRPLLPPLFTWPLQTPATYTMMAFHQITPQASGFLARRTERAPFRGGLWHPMYFYRAIAHEESVSWFSLEYHGNKNLLALQANACFTPRSMSDVRAGALHAQAGRPPPACPAAATTGPG